MSSALKILLELLGPLLLVLFALARLFRLHINVLSANASERFISSTQVSTYLGIVVSYLSGWSLLLFIWERVLHQPEVDVHLFELVRGDHPVVALGIFLGGFFVFSYLYIKMQKAGVQHEQPPMPAGWKVDGGAHSSIRRKQRFWLIVALAGFAAVLVVLLYPGPATVQPRPDEAAWKELQAELRRPGAKGRSKLCQAFVARFASSENAGNAKRCVEEFEDEDDWEAAIGGGALKDIDAYLAKHPNGKYANEAALTRQKLLSEGTKRRNDCIATARKTFVSTIKALLPVLKSDVPWNESAAHYFSDEKPKAFALCIDWERSTPTFRAGVGHGFATKRSGDSQELADSLARSNCAINAGKNSSEVRACCKVVDRGNQLDGLTFPPDWPSSCN